MNARQRCERKSRGRGKESQEEQQLWLGSMADADLGVVISLRGLDICFNSAAVTPSERLVGDMRGEELTARADRFIVSFSNF